MESLNRITGHLSGESTSHHQWTPAPIGYSQKVAFIGACVGYIFDIDIVAQRSQLITN